MNEPVGLGSANAQLSVHIANRPPLARYQNLKNFTVLSPGEIASVAKETGNHWRKIFNVYAKLVYALDQKIESVSGQKKAVTSLHFGSQRYDNWQTYRDAVLLQAGSDTALWFNKKFDASQGSSSGQSLHIIMGRQYAASLDLPAMVAFDADFSVNREQRVIIVPYFDYRQLSNKKLEILVGLIFSLFSAGD